MNALSACDLAPGDVVEIRCRFTHFENQSGFVERWVAARIIATDSGRPTVQLDDDQVTEIRPFMLWRIVHRAAAAREGAKAA